MQDLSDISCASARTVRAPTSPRREQRNPENPFRSTICRRGVSAACRRRANDVFAAHVMVPGVVRRAMASSAGEGRSRPPHATFQRSEFAGPMRSGL